MSYQKKLFPFFKNNLIFFQQFLIAGLYTHAVNTNWAIPFLPMDNFF